MSVDGDPPVLPEENGVDIDMAAGAQSLELQQTARTVLPKTTPHRRELINVEYTMADTGPNRIFFEPLTVEDRINKFSVGSTLRKMEQYRRHIVNMKQVGRNKIMVYLNSYAKANSLVKEVQSGKIGRYRAYVPLHLICVTGVIAGVPADIPEKEIFDDIQCEVPIVSVRRLNRFVDGAITPTNRISVMFRSNVLPERVKLFCCSSRITPFVQKLVICENCLRFNHRASQCKGRKRCERCSIQHESPDQFRSCANEAKCAFCKSSSHTSNFDKCPDKLRQISIKRLMAKRTVTYAEAREQIPITSNMFEPLTGLDEFPTLHESFATVAGNATTSSFRKQWSQANQERAKITPAVKLFKNKEEKKKAGAKRQRTDNKNKEENSLNDETANNSSENGVALNNPFKVSDKERWENITKEEKRKAEMAASLNVKTTMMSFYSDFLNQLEDSEEIARKFKNCTEKYFNLAHTVEANLK